ncbi:MAG: hypothetical protein V4736_12630 [Bdellovibrionota bacterium]
MGYMFLKTNSLLKLRHLGIALAMATIGSTSAQAAEMRITEDAFQEYEKNITSNTLESRVKLVDYYESLDLHSLTYSLMMEEFNKKSTHAKPLLEKALKLTSMEPFFDKGQLDNWVKSFKPARSGFDLLDLLDLKHQWDTQKLSTTEPFLQKLNDASPFYNEALLMLSLIDWKHKKFTSSLGYLELLAKKKDNSFHNQVMLLKARIQFSQGDYPSAMENYRKLQSQFYLWPEAMMEAAWAQVQMKDYEKAAGSMYSLHQDYFKKVYFPESYFVRSLAYFSLCQFGDALQVVQNFEKKYSLLQKSMDKYLVKDPKVAKLRGHTIEFLQTKVNSSGLPKALILNLVADPEYVFLQDRVNTFEQQNQLSVDFNQVVLTKARTMTKFEKAEDRKKLAEFRKNLESFRKVSLSHSEKKLNAFRESMDKYFKKKFLKTNLDLKQNLLETQKLRFEIYSRASNDLGSLKPENETVKVRDPATENEATWSFIGEIWEDEVGHFKSSLENRCR